MRRRSAALALSGSLMLLLVGQSASATVASAPYLSAGASKTTCPDPLGGVATASSTADKTTGSLSASAFASSTAPVGIEILPAIIQTGCGVGYSRAAALASASQDFAGAAVGSHSVSATFNFGSAPVATGSFSGPSLPPIALPCQGCPGIALTGNTAIVGVGITALWFAPGCSTNDIVNFLDGDSRGIDQFGCAVFSLGGPSQLVTSNGGPVPSSSVTVTGTVNVPAAGGTVVTQPTLAVTATVAGAGTASASASAGVPSITFV